MFSYIINVIFSYIIDISKNIIYLFSSLYNKNEEELYLIEPTNTNNINTSYRNSISCPNNLYSHNKYKISVNKPLVINLNLRCDKCKRIIMKDNSIYCFNDKIFCSEICRTI